MMVGGSLPKRLSLLILIHARRAMDATMMLDARMLDPTKVVVDIYQHQTRMAEPRRDFIADLTIV